MQASPKPDKSSVQHWLDALVSKSCSQEEFLQQIGRLQARDPDVAWEVLALLDQHVRRKLISHEILVSLKGPLHLLSLGVSSDSAPRQSAESAMAPLQTTGSPAEVEKVSRHALQRGDVLRGRYRIVDVLGEHESSTLFEGIDELRANMPGVRSRRAIRMWEGPEALGPEFVQRLCELQALSHPGIVRVFDVEVDSDVALLTREWLTGTSLSYLIFQSGGTRLATQAAQTIIRTLASALMYAHSRDVCHGNLRESNIFITDAGEIRLKGFEFGNDWQANPRSDRLAFARLAYKLLSGWQTSDMGDSPPTTQTRLREPPGLTREQWRILRDTLLGKEQGLKGNVLTAFAGNADASGRVTLPEAFARRPVNLRRLNSWIASGVVAAFLAIAVYLAVVQNRRSTPEAPMRSTASVPVPEAPAVAATAAPPEVGPRVEPAVEVKAPSGVVPDAALSNAPAVSNLRALIDLPAEVLEVRGDQPAARIWVRRRGGLDRAVTFRWWTETGSAKPDLDFAAVAPQSAVVPGGSQGVALMVPLVSDPSRREPRTFYIKIDETGLGASLGERTLMQIMIVPPF